MNVNLRKSKKEHFERVCKDMSKKLKQIWDELGHKVRSDICQLKTGCGILTSSREFANQLTFTSPSRSNNTRSSRYYISTNLKMMKLWQL